MYLIACSKIGKDIPNIKKMNLNSKIHPQNSINVYI